MSRHLVGNPNSWQRVAERAVSLMINRTEFVFSNDDVEFGSEALLRVTSATEEGAHYAVRVLQDLTGVHSVKCTCQASFYGRRCWHAAAALIRCGIVSMQVEVAPANEHVVIELIAAD